MKEHTEMSDSEERIFFMHKLLDRFCWILAIQPSLLESDGIKFSCDAFLFCEIDGFREIQNSVEMLFVFVRMMLLAFVRLMAQKHRRCRLP
jgi:hypothetical protein